MIALNDCEKMVSEYIDWIKKGISIQEIENTYEITTPFLNRHNDHLQIYVKQVEEKLILTDDGYTIRDLRLSGFDFSTEKRQNIIKTLLMSFGIKNINDELIVETDRRNFARSKHNLIQAMLSIDDLFILAAPFVARVFKQDVENYLRQNRVRFTPSVKFTGKTGFDHHFDFVIPASDKQPERIIKAINSPVKSNITNYIFSWTDTKEARNYPTTAYAIINDTDKELASELVSALKEYEIKSIPWSKKDNYIDELAA